MIKRHYEVQTLAYIPIGRAIDMPEQVPSAAWLKLDTTCLDQSVNGIVADLHSYDLTDEWQQFIANKTLQGIPVYHHRHIRESLTGRVKINHMYENDLGSLLPSYNYMVVKRFLEIALILVSIPITIPIILITIVLIKLESSGPVLFMQQRVGVGGKEFIIYKLRSMSKDSESNGAKMASKSDMRVTRVGKFIRKTRIDELPQFWNIIKGEMSLIGPRPEQKFFVDEFDNTIPFYNYRHIVKPGITGWAQVMHGYAADEDETKIKVEHDFYYIKHFSFTLDLLIVFKTLHTMITGFGAR
jgi:exopolysaccharide biosynthesis polyprenyl glycosylphosphotransferase